MRIAVTGREGQVVSSLLERGTDEGHEIIAVGRPGLDLAHPETVAPALTAIRPDVIVSSAAYTAVDKAESESELAYAINALGAGAIAEAARTMGIPLVHISTDYVFSGLDDRPYAESSATEPAGVYGASKLAGETAVLGTYGDNSAILRTAWVYSPFGANFAKTMLRLASEREEVSVVADQFGNPTNALDIAAGILRVAENLAASSDGTLRGVFHMTATGEASWADFAEAIFAASQAHGGPFARVKRITTAEYPTPAVRPANSRLDCSLIRDVHGIILPDWRKSANEVVARLVSSAA